MSEMRMNDMTFPSVGSTCSVEPVAIVGMAVRLPRARTLDEFWQNLLDGHEAVREFTAEELAAAGVPEGMRRHPGHVARGVALEDVDQFDADFFGFTPQEARVTDPQHRLFLETSWRALEDAGVAPRAFPRAIGVFASCSMSTYLLNNILSGGRPGEECRLSYPVLIGNDKDFLAARVSYKLGLTGPSLTVQSACSSSLVALHEGAASLRTGDCDVALVGGVSVTVPQTAGHVHKEGGVTSRDDHCRPFDRAAGGTVRGNGAAAVVLKRLGDALVDRDRIYAVVKGSAVNNDGTEKIGFTAPSVQGQTEVVSAAVAAAGIDADEIGYVEVHGTGTALGDSIEIRALSRAHGATRECALGSVKANPGHLDVAAGIVGVIKAALVVRKQVVPPQINFTAANGRIPPARSRYPVHTEACVPTEPITHAAVSSFGLGGTNGHCVLGRYIPADREPVPSGVAFVLTLSAKTPEALERQALALRSFLDKAQPRLDDLAFSLGTGRELWGERLAVAAGTLEEARSGLEEFLAWGTRASAHPVAAAFVAGEEVSPDRLGALGAAVRISLPPYPFETQSYWIGPVAPAGAAPVAPGRAVPSRAGGVRASEVQAEIISILRELLGIDEIGAEDDFFALGGDSLAAVDAVGMVRERYSVDLAIDGFAALRTPRALSTHIARLLDGSTSRSATVRVRGGEGRPLFLIYPAGGSNFCYFRLAEHLDFDGPLTAFSYPCELGEGEVTIRELAELYVAQMRAVQPEGPYLVGGYSFGGNLAFEVALRLQREGAKVSALYLFDAHPPAAYVGESLDERGFLAALPRLMASMPPDGGIRRDAAPPRTVREAVEVLKRRPDWLASSEEDLRRFITVWRRNHGALKGYYPDGRVECRVVVFDAQEPHPEEEVELLRIKLLGKEFWQPHISGEFRVVPVPGNHYTMFTDRELVPHLAAALQAELDVLAE